MFDLGTLFVPTKDVYRVMTLCIMFRIGSNTSDRDCRKIGNLKLKVQVLGPEWNAPIILDYESIFSKPSAAGLKSKRFYVILSIFSVASLIKSDNPILQGYRHCLSPDD